MGKAPALRERPARTLDTFIRDFLPQDRQTLAAPAYAPAPPTAGLGEPGPDLLPGPPSPLPP